MGERGRRRARLARGVAAAAVLLCAAAALLWAGIPFLGRLGLDRSLIETARASPRLPAISPAYAPALSAFFLRGVPARPRVGIQAGHWKQEELPSELGRLWEATGAVSGSFREVDINLAVARELATLLESAGIDADIFPATVPPAYLADAFVSIHADGADRPTARGWKIAAPWRASPASILLMEAVSRSYAHLSGLPEDRYGVTYGMKGYYAFSSQRVRFAVSPFTPCIIVETGFVTVAADRDIIARQPVRVAGAIAAGLLDYLAHRPRPTRPDGRAAYLPPSYGVTTVAAAESLLRAGPGEDEPLVARLEQGTAVLPMQWKGEWAEVVVRGNFRSFGWVLARDLKAPG